MEYVIVFLNVDWGNCVKVYISTHSSFRTVFWVVAKAYSINNQWYFYYYEWLCQGPEHLCKWFFQLSRHIFCPQKIETPWIILLSSTVHQTPSEIITTCRPLLGILCPISIPQNKLTGYSHGKFITTNDSWQFNLLQQTWWCCLMPTAVLFPHRPLITALSSVPREYSYYM